MPRKPLADRGTQTSLRLPRELYDRLTEAAGDRGIGEEIRTRLDASFAETPKAGAAADDPWFGDLLTAIRHAAAGAVRLKQNPTLPPGTMERDGKRRSYDVARRGQDTTAYATFAEATLTLLQALAPTGVVAVSEEAKLRLADQLVALALGALGQRGLAAFGNLPETDRRFMKHSGGDAQRFAEAAEAAERQSEGRDE